MKFADLKDFSYEDAKALFKKKKYAFFENGNLNLNIFGIRLKTGVNKFDDVICVAYKNKSGNVKLLKFMATTDPGMAYLHGPLSEKGTAILVEGQYRGAFQIAHHQGKYIALCQRKPVKVYRDDNKDSVHDMNSNSTVTGVFGINIHRSNPKTESTYVDKWSAGCQVFKKVADFDRFMKLVSEAAQLYGNSFTYTLFNASELPKK